MLKMFQRLADLFEHLMVAFLVGFILEALMSFATKHLIRIAVGRLPETQRLRYATVWRNQIDQQPGLFLKFMEAVGFVPAALIMAFCEEHPVAVCFIEV